ERVDRIPDDESHEDGDDGNRVLDQGTEQLAAGVRRRLGLVGDGLDQFALLDVVVERKRLLHEAAEGLLAEAVQDLHVDPEHAVFVEKFENAADQEKGGNAETNAEDEYP